MTFDRLLTLAFLACSAACASRPARELWAELKERRAHLAHQQEVLAELATARDCLVAQNLAAFQREISEVSHYGLRGKPEPTGFVSP